MRALLRHRDSLVKTASRRSVLHMQKAFDQMNVHLHHTISDPTGDSGLAITDAFLGGERDPTRLAALAHPRIKASRATLIKALQGDWRSEHLFTLRHPRQSYAHYQQLISECDQEIETHIRAFEQTHEAPAATATDQQPRQSLKRPRNRLSQLRNRSTCRPISRGCTRPGAEIRVELFLTWLSRRARRINWRPLDGN